MKKHLFVLSVCWLAALMPVLADGLPSLPNPPVSDGINEEDVQTFVDNYILKDKAIRVGAREYEYSIHVTDDLEGRVEYSLSGQFSVQWDTVAKAWQCKATPITVNRSGSTDTLLCIASLKDGNKDGPVWLVIANYADPDLQPEDVVGDVPDGIGSFTAFLGEIMMAGEVPVADPTPHYEPPMMLSLPMQEGLFPFEMTLNDEGVMSEGWDLLLSADKYPFFVRPSVGKMAGCLKYVTSKFLHNGQRVFFSTTATIKEYDPE